MLTSLRKLFITTAAALTLAVVPLAVPAAVYAADPNIEDNLACGSTLDVDAQDCRGQLSGGTDRIQSIITAIVNLFSVVVGIVAVIMIIVGGFKYITSGGESSNITSAKNTIVYAVIGLVIVALAQFVVQFVLDKATA